MKLTTEAVFAPDFLEEAFRLIAMEDSTTSLQVVLSRKPGEAAVTLHLELRDFESGESDIIHVTHEGFQYDDYELMSQAMQLIIEEEGLKFNEFGLNMLDRAIEVWLDNPQETRQDTDGSTSVEFLAAFDFIPDREALGFNGELASDPFVRVEFSTGWQNDEEGDVPELYTTSAFVIELTPE